MDSRASASSSCSSGTVMTQRRWFLSGVPHQYAEATEVSFSVGIAEALARSSEAATSPSAASESSSQNSKPLCTTGTNGAPVSSSSCSRRPPGTVRRDGTGLPGAVVSASSSASARSRLRSPEEDWVCRPSRIEPSGRRRAGQASGSTVASVTDGTSPSACSATPAASVSGTVAAGTSSRSATQSASPGSPSNGRCTSSCTACAASRP